MLNGLIQFIIQNKLLSASFILSVVSFVLSFVAVCFNKKGKKQSENEYRITIIKATVLLGSLCVLVVLFYQLFFSTVGIGADKGLFDMQAITLTITGISISLISIISTVLTSKREEKYDKIEDSLRRSIKGLEDEKGSLLKSLNELENMQTKLREDSECLTELMLTDNMFLEKRKERFLFDLASKNDSFFEKYFYIRTLHNKYSVNASQETKEHWYKLIIEQGEQLVKDLDKKDLSSVLDKNQKYLMLIMLSDAYFFLAESNIMNRTSCVESTIMGYFDKAESYYNQADELFADEDGYISNGRGLFAYWKYKYHLSKGDVKVELLDSSIKFYQMAIQNNPLKAQYYNNKGVSYLQKAKMLQNKNEHLNCAEECFRETLRLDSHAAKASINLADIGITKMRVIMGANDEIVILQALEQREENFDVINRYYEDGEFHLNNATYFEPYFVNGYYKKAQLYCYYLLFKEKTDILKRGEKEVICEKIKQLFDSCEAINPNSKGVFYIKRLYYDVINDFDSAKRINEDIRIFNKKNAEEWQNAFDKYIENKK